jgi:hypothetical protein
MSRDEMVIDVEVSAISRNHIRGEPGTGAGGVVENISQRTVPVVPKRGLAIRGLLDRITGGRGSPLFPKGTEVRDELTMVERFRSGDPFDEE